VIRRILRVVAEKRRQHSRELRGALTWNGLLAILHRERIPVVRTPLVRSAALLSGGGVTVMLLNADVPGRRHLAFAAHELAHAWLHVHEGSEVCFHMDDVWPEGDAREDEAELLATWLLGSHAVRRAFVYAETATQLRLALDE
jgi:hypothetical protein